MSAGEKYLELDAAVNQAAAALDVVRRYLERAVRDHDACPDGDPRKAEIERRVSRLLAQKSDAERVAGVAVDALLDFERAHPEVAR
jgi:hypothetical protein